MKTPFPITIIDNFFDDPDKIVEFGNQQKFYPTTDGRGPGSRTLPIEQINDDFRRHLVAKLSEVMFTHYSDCEGMAITTSFQKVDPFHEDQYHKKNRGWVHKDHKCQVGGIVYLNRNPEKDTGLSFYKFKNGFYVEKSELSQAKEALYLGKDIDDETYERCWDLLHDEFVETMKIEHVYNRCIIFNGSSYHGVPTYGKEQTRLTLPFFIRSVLYQ